MKRGFALLDVILSITLISIIASILLPILISSNMKRQKLDDYSEIYLIAENQLEIVTAAKYRNKKTYELIIPDDYVYNLSEEDINENLILIKLQIAKKGDKEVEFYKIFKKKGI